jgi:hypothetical protein
MKNAASRISAYRVAEHDESNFPSRHHSDSDLKGLPASLLAHGENRSR